MRFPLRSLPVGVGTCLLLTAACTTMRPVDRAELSPPNPLTRVWVTRADHTPVLFEFAQVRGDSLVGYVDAQPQSLPLSEATVLRVREPSPEMTIALAMAVGGAMVVAVIVTHPWNDDRSGPL